MLTQTLQGALQAEIRSATGKTDQDFNGDLHDLCTIYGVPMAPISGRIIPVAQIFDSSINSSASALNYLLNNASTVVGPRGLFASGEQGAWYDPSDLTTLFTDSAGTTPVTAVEQSVGLMLDKSKGLVLGSELVTNGDFSGGTTGWTGVNATLAVVNGAVQITADGVGQARASQTVSGLTAGRWYEVRAKIWQGTGTVNVTLLATGVAESAAVTTTTPTDVVVRFAAIATTQTIRAGSSGIAVAGTTYFADNISVKELPGNHAYQTTSASRPTLRARYNLLTYSEQFDNGIWSKAANCTVTPDNTSAPDGAITADRIVISAANAISGPSNTAGTFSGLHTQSWYVKQAATVRYVQLLWTSVGVSSDYANFDLQTGTLTAGTYSSANIQNVGNGWYRISLTSTLAAVSGGCWIIAINTINATRAGSYPGTGAESFFIWGAQLAPTAVFPSNTYQRIAAATDYDTSGFPPYLFFDGVDDSLLTNSVDFSAGDKMTVWAGMTKTSQATNQRIVELSSSVSTNNGSFQFWPGDWSTGTGSRYSFSSRGTTAIDQSQAAESPANYAAPISNVLAAIGDISGDSSILRINGVQVATGTGDQGTGNFGNYPLYIGRRNNASLPLNGNIYSLIIRGAQSTAAQISSTESWVAAKTPLGSL